MLNIVETATMTTAVQLPSDDYLATQRFTLFDTTTSTEITSLQPDATIDTTAIPTGAAIQVRIAPEQVGSVVVDLDGAVTVDNAAPYTIAIPPVGSYALTATPHREADWQGEAGRPLTLTFTVSAAD